MIADVLRNMNLFVDGRGYAGRIDELTLPKLTVKMEEHRAGGMDAPVELDMGMEKLEAEFSLSAFDLEVLRLWGITAGAQAAFTARGALQSEDGTVTALVVHMRGQIRELDHGTWKPGEKAMLKASLALRYYKLTHGQTVVTEIDVENMVRVVGGVDQLAAMRQALGI